MNPADVKPLECWVTTTEAEQILGVSRQAIHKMMWEQDLFIPDEIRRIGLKKPTYLLDAVAVYDIKKMREDEAREVKEQRALKAQMKTLREQLS
jgi:hypothetical protein